MQQILVISGKGGTGKTSITAALASFAHKSIFVDCDVDAADLFIIFNPKNFEDYDFESGETASLNKSACTYCKKCVEFCRFDAISDLNGEIIINAYSCEGCRVCMNFCPTQAITMTKKTGSKWFIGKTRFGKLIHARLAPGEDNSGKLVSKIREKSQQIATEENLDYIILDGPPGIGCPVIAAASGINKALIVTEPSVSALHDFERMIELLKKLDRKTCVMINKFDLNLSISKEIESICTKINIEVVGKLPFDQEFTKAMIAGKNIVEFNPDSIISKTLEQIWNKLS